VPGGLTRADVIAKYPDRTQRVVNALVRAMKFMAISSGQKVAAALSDEFRGGANPTDWAIAFGHSRPAYTTIGRINPDAVKNVIEANEFFLGKKLSIDPAKLYDNSFVEKAAKSVKV